jgi:glycolate oxidase FAD binding subunit
VSVIDALREACGPAHAREATVADAVGGAVPGWVAAPAASDELMAVLQIAADERLSVVASGAGTKLDWGASPTGLDVLIDVARMSGVYDHDPDNELATIGAGTPLRAVRAALAAAGQRLALDVGSPGATLGGVIATNEAGPLRLAFGPPSDLVIGVQAGLADGRLARQLAGFDLARLMCGSFGTLGVLAEATVRVHPIPAGRAWVIRPVATPRDVQELTYALLASSFAPVAIECDLPTVPAAPVVGGWSGGGPIDSAGGPAAPGGRADGSGVGGSGAGGRAGGGPRGGRSARSSGASQPAGGREGGWTASSSGPRTGELAVLMEGASAVTRAEAVARILGGGSIVADVPPVWWGRYPFGTDDVALKISAPSNELFAVIYALRDAAGVPVPVRGSSGVGVAYASLPATLGAARIDGVLTAARSVMLGRGGGSCVVLRAPEPLRGDIDATGPVPLTLTDRQAKAALDPEGRLAPGRYPLNGLP